MCSYIYFLDLNGDFCFCDAYLYLHLFIYIIYIYILYIIYKYYNYISTVIYIICIYILYIIFIYLHLFTLPFSFKDPKTLPWEMVFGADTCRRLNFFAE